MFKRNKLDVKVIKVHHGIGNNARPRAVEKAIKMWMKKGYRLDKQQDKKGGCISRGYTMLTFIKEPNP